MSVKYKLSQARPHTSKQSILQLQCRYVFWETTIVSHMAITTTFGFGFTFIPFLSMFHTFFYLPSNFTTLQSTPCWTIFSLVMQSIVIYLDQFYNDWQSYFLIMQKKHVLEKLNYFVILNILINSGDWVLATIFEYLTGYITSNSLL